MNPLSEDTIEDLAALLDKATQEISPIAQLSLSQPYTLAEAYQIQSAGIDLRYERGEDFLGVKMGFTSRAKMKERGVDELIWGVLTDRMLIRNEGRLKTERLIKPRVEPELCFLVKKPIDKEIKPSELGEYIGAVAPAVEVIDSRYADFKFAVEDVIADNCSAAAMVLGTWYPTSHDPVDDLKIEFLINNEVVQSGLSSAILGDPWNSVIECSKLMGKYNQFIPEGSFILAGAITKAMHVQKRDKVLMRVDGQDEVMFEVV